MTVDDQAEPSQRSAEQNTGTGCEMDEEGRSTHVDHHRHQDKEEKLEKTPQELQQESNAKGEHIKPELPPRSDEERRNEVVPYASIEQVVKGGVLLKFGRHGAPHFREFHVTKDCVYLVWHSPRKNAQDTKVDLRECTLVEGQNTAVFRKHDREDLKSVSFSLVVVTEGRTIDLVCQDKMEYDVWVTALRYLIKHGPPPLSTSNMVRRSNRYEKDSSAPSSLLMRNTIEADLAERPSVDSTIGAEQGGERTLANNKKSAIKNRQLRSKIKDSNYVYTWGFGGWGQLGLGTVADKQIPVLVDSLFAKEIRQISCGADHTMALTENGELFGWGNAGSGRLGIGNEGLNHCLQPVPVTIPEAPGERFTTVACGGMHTVACTNRGEVYAWGCNARGQLGIGDYIDRTTPCLVSSVMGGQSVFQLAAGISNTAALSATGEIFTWGGNELFCLGHGEQSLEEYTEPKSIDAQSLRGQKIISVCIGGFFMGALSSERKLYTWGFGGTGALGHGDFENRSTPTLVQALDDKEIRSIDAGAGHMAALINEPTLNTRVVYTWGLAKSGQLGQGGPRYVEDNDDASPVGLAVSNTDSSKEEHGPGIGKEQNESDDKQHLPGIVTRLHGQSIEMVSCGSFHTAAVSERGELYVWGDASFGQLGIGAGRRQINGNGASQHQQRNSNIEYEPILVSSLENKVVRSVFCGGRHTCITVAKNEKWLDDSETPACMSCQSLFTFINRRHHCRNCGGIFCSKCSSKRQPLLRLGHIEPVRVCDECYDRLNA